MSIAHLSRNNSELEILFYGDIGVPPLTSAAVAKLLDANKDAKVIRCRINSPGGDPFEGIAIYNMLQRHGAAIESEIDGQASSAASYIAMAGKVRIAENALMMIHEAQASGGGSASQLAADAQMLTKINESAAMAYAAKTGKTEDEIRELMKSDKWMSAKEALELKFVDEVVASKKVAAKLRTVLTGLDKSVRSAVEETIVKLGDAVPATPALEAAPPEEPADDTSGTDVSADPVLDALAQDTGLDRAALVALLQESRDDIAKILNEKIERDGTPSEAMRDHEMPHDDEEDPEMSLKLTVALRQLAALSSEVESLKADKAAREEQALDAEIEAMASTGHLLEAEKPKARALLKKDPEAFRDLFSTRKVPARQTTEVVPERKPGEMPKLDELSAKARSQVRALVNTGFYDTSKAIAKVLEQERN